MPLLAPSTIRLLRRSVLCVTGWVSLSLVLSPPGWADYQSSNSSRPDTLPANHGGTRAFIPPADLRPPEEDHTGAGSRGCGPIAAIAPRLSAVGQTASTQPTFIWYDFCPADNPVEFQLYQFAADGSLDLITVQQIETAQPGFMAYTLLPTVASLTVGENYLWQVVRFADDDFEHRVWQSSAEIEVVDLPATVAPTTTDTAIAQARAYGAAGLWYDAIAAVHTVPGPEAAALRQTLLLDLAALEAQFDSPINLSTQLRQIAETGNSRVPTESR